jgi:hypothetical protein
MTCRIIRTGMWPTRRQSILLPPDFSWDILNELKEKNPKKSQIIFNSNLNFLATFIPRSLVSGDWLVWEKIYLDVFFKKESRLVTKSRELIWSQLLTYLPYLHCHIFYRKWYEHLNFNITLKIYFNVMVKLVFPWAQSFKATLPNIFLSPSSPRIPISMKV